MRKKMGVLFLIGTVFSVFNLSSPAFAGEGTTGDYFVGMGKNLGRGLWNIVSSPAEIPCAMGPEMSSHPAYGFFSGLGIGTGLMLRRILVGASEFGTFVMPSEATIPPVCQEKSSEITT